MSYGEALVWSCVAALGIVIVSVGLAIGLVFVLAVVRQTGSER